MDYQQIVTIVCYALTAVMALLCVHYMVLAIIGLVKKKKFPEAVQKHPLGIVISARNEEQVIGNLLRSIQKNDYPKDKLKIFVVAHNCTDQTANVCREIAKVDPSVQVFEYNNEQEKTKGYALKYLFDQLNALGITKTLDGFICLDADNILSTTYISKMNDAFDYYNCESTVVSFRNTKNMNTNVISACHGMYFLQGCVFESRGRTVVGCSTRVPGTGFIFSSKVVENGWEYVTLTEDWEYSADQLLRNSKINYCDEAEFFDEQPTELKISVRQRVRWARGHLLVFFSKTARLFCKLFQPKKKGEKSVNKFSVYDMFISTLPFMVVTISLFMVQVLLRALTPVFMPNIDISLLWLDILYDFLFFSGVYYITSFLSCVVVFIAERKRIKKMNPLIATGMLFFYPIFLILAYAFEVIALFAKNLTWKPIPHKDRATHESLNV